MNTNATPYAPIAPLMEIDAYKLSHRTQYALTGNVTRVYSNFTNRKSRLEGVNGVVHFGLQAFLQEYCIEAFQPFFEADEDEVARLYAERYTQVVGGDPADVDVSHIRGLHRLGYLPLVFSGVPEGTVVPLGVPSFVVENTHPDFYWLPNYIEPVLSAIVWHPSTTATIAHRLRTFLDVMAERTASVQEAVDFQGHDFSFRGQASPQSAAGSGAGHLLSFLGSDSIISMEWVDHFYAGDNGMVLGSVPATEHSVMSTGIAVNGEEETFKRLLEAYPSGILSVVSDTFDLWRVLQEYLPNLKNEVLGRDGKLVIRPDTGNPADIICGERTGDIPDADRVEDSPADKGVLELLWDEFGGTVNDKGYRELDPHVGVIYGDSITYERAQDICERMERMGFASTNVVFGVGSYTYQYVTRDTFNSAMKATWAEVDGEGVDLFKNPVTGDGVKRSATGRLAVIRDGDTLKLIEKATPEQEADSVLQPVWRDGQFLRYQSFADVRKTLKEQQ